jgi:hypothetical protein
MWICFLGLTLVACSSLSDIQRMDAFDETAKNYRRALEWSDFDLAASFLSPADEAALAAAIERMKAFQITAYDVKKLRVIDEHRRIEQVVDLSYFKKDSMVVLKARDTQLWEYDPEQDRWQLTSGFPQLK